MPNPSTIVLIDPERDTTTALASRLEMQGYAVTVNHDPAEGARAALADPPGAVVADLWMPGISGVQLCRLLKAEPATEHVPVLLRGPDGSRNQFWAERAGASAYVIKGRMGDLVRALQRAIAAAPPSDGFFTTFGGVDIRERIAAHLDAALFESVLASELRALGSCGEFPRLFDLLSQFVSRIAPYRWLAVSTVQPRRLGIHHSPRDRRTAEAEARAALNLTDEPPVIRVEDDDAHHLPAGAEPIVRTIQLGRLHIGDLAISLVENATQDESFPSIVAREIAAPLRMATLVEESQRLATIDPLTGLLNRRAFTEALQRELAACTRYGRALSFVLLDIDHFKEVNDLFGHAAGDAALTSLGEVLRAGIRASDFAARWGGEEFVVALTCTELSGALTFAERLRRSIEELSAQDDRWAPIPLTASIGVAAHTSGEALDRLVERADRAMYAAKQAGRNRVVLANSVPLRASETPPPGNHHAPMTSTSTP